MFVEKEMKMIVHISSPADLISVGTSLIVFSPGILRPQLLTLIGGVGVTKPDS